MTTFLPKMKQASYGVRSVAILALVGVFLWPAACEAASESPQERYEDVRAAFEKQNFELAQELADTMLVDRQFSPQLFQILGHIRYRQNDLGRAALWYLRASLFPPPSPEVRQNIAHIHEMTGNLRFPTHSFREQFSAYLSRMQWAYMAMIGGWSLIFAITVIVLVRSVPLRTLMMVVGVVSALAVTFGTLGWYWHTSYEKLENLAVVTSADVRAYTAASVTSGTVGPLPPGSEVRKLTDRGTWSYVEIPPSQHTVGDESVDRIPLRGWVKTDALTLCWPFDPGYLE